MQLKISYFHLQTGHYKYKTFYVGSWKPPRKHIVNTQKIKRKVLKHTAKETIKKNIKRRTKKYRYLKASQKTMTIIGFDYLFKK